MSHIKLQVVVYSSNTIRAVLRISVLCTAIKDHCTSVSAPQRGASSQLGEATRSLTCQW